jgi:signal transduction histidine kinase
VVIKVSDNGIGIPADYFKMPFERFNRGSNVGAIPGTGLGLSIVKRYADLHGGEISIDSQVNGGTTVTIKIPRNPHGNKGDHNE